MRASRSSQVHKCRCTTRQEQGNEHAVLPVWTKTGRPWRAIMVPVHVGCQTEPFVAVQEYHKRMQAKAFKDIVREKVQARIKEYVDAKVKQLRQAKR